MNYGEREKIVITTCASTGIGRALASQDIVQVMKSLINPYTKSLGALSFKYRAFAYIFILLIPEISQAQTDSMPDLMHRRSFRFYNAEHVSSTFLENESGNSLCDSDSTYSITLIVKNVRNNKGVIRFKFYDDETPFPHDTGFLRIVVPKSQVINNTYMATYHGFISGYIGIALHDDENSNKKLDFEWFIPREGYAFSDYYHTTFRRPDFENFRFQLKEDRVVVMVMRYH